MTPIQQIIAGAPAKTRDGREAKYLWSYNSNIGQLYLFIVSEAGHEAIIEVDSNGSWLPGERESRHDILLSPPEPVKGWIAVSKKPGVVGNYPTSIFCPNKEDLAYYGDHYHIIPVTLPSE
jgi:hypothetical protein